VAREETSARGLIADLKRRNPLPDGAVPVGAGLAVTGVATIVFFAVAARVLSPDDYDILAVLWAVLFTVGNGVMQPLEQEVARAVADRRAKGIGTRPIIHRASIIGLTFTAALAVAAAVAHDWLVDHLFDGSTAALAAFVVGLLGFCLGHLVRGTLSSHGRFGAYGLFFGVDGAVRPIGALVFWAAGVAAIGAWGLLVAVAPFVAAAVALRGQRDLGRPGPPASWGELTQKLGWLLLGTGCNALLINGGVIAVALLAESSQEAAAGLFLSGLIIARIPLFFFQAVLAGLLPKLSHLAGVDDLVEFRAVLRRLCAAIGAFGALAVIAAVAVGPAVVSALFSAEGELTGRDLGLLASFAVLLMLAVTLGQAVVALGGHGRMAIGWLGATAVFAGVTFAGSDLFLRVELGLVSAALFASCWMAFFVAEQLRRRSPPSHEVDLSEAVAEVPLQP
jgi:O-antigen/teichoic acid export membrane protein